MGTSNIADKVVVITGASSGIGESTAKLLRDKERKSYWEPGVRTGSMQSWKRFRPQAVRLSGSPST